MKPRLGAALVVLGGLAGCAHPEQPAAQDAATRFTAAVAAGDTATACALLAPSSRAALEEQESGPCPDVLGQLGLPEGDVRSTEVWGGRAQVLTDGDTLFLTDGPDGWAVAAAGCTPQGEAPYDCRLEGP